MPHNVLVALALGDWDELSIFFGLRFDHVSPSLGQPLTLIRTTSAPSRHPSPAAASAGSWGATFQGAAELACDTADPIAPQSDAEALESDADVEDKAALALLNRVALTMSVVLLVRSSAKARPRPVASAFIRHYRSSQAVLACSLRDHPQRHLVTIAVAADATHSFSCSCRESDCEHILGTRYVDVDVLAHQAPWRMDTGPAYALLHETTLAAQYFFYDALGRSSVVKITLTPNFWYDLKTADPVTPYDPRMGLLMVLRTLRKASWVSDDGNTELATFLKITTSTVRVHLPEPTQQRRTSLHSPRRARSALTRSIRA